MNPSKRFNLHFHEYWHDHKCKKGAKLNWNSYGEYFEDGGKIIVIYCKVCYYAVKSTNHRED